MPDPTVRWEWERSPATRGDRVAAGLAVLGGPLGILGLAASPSGPGFHLPVELNLQTGNVTVFNEVPPGVGGRAHTLLVRSSTSQQPAVQAALNETYRTGVIPAGLPDNYQHIARSLVEIRRGEPRTDANVPAPPFAPLPIPPEAPTVLPSGGDFLPSNLSGVPTMVPILPSGIAAAFGQQTPANQLLQQTGARTGTPRRRASRAVGAGRPRRRRRVAARGGKFVKGSAAAKRHMAKLRRMRRKK